MTIHRYWVGLYRVEGSFEREPTTLQAVETNINV